MASSTNRLFTFAVLICAAITFACGAATGDAGKGADKAKKADAAAATSATTPIATVGDKPITLQDLALVMINKQEFDARRQALDELINDQLMDREAAAKGTTRDKLMESEVNSKIPDPPQSEVDAWFEQNKARLGAQPKEQVVPQISAMLKNQKLGDAQRTYLKALRDKYGVKVMMEPPRIEVSLDDDAAKGPAKAPVTIVEFSDYQCPFCSRAETTVTEVLKKYGDKVRIVYRDYPLGFHQNAQKAAEASECAKEQGKFWEMHGAMFANQGKLAVADLIETAGGIGLDKDKFKTCVETGKYQQEVQKDFQDGSRYGVSGTPTFFINGIKMVGAKGTDAFAEIIEAELARQK
jgi:protein-disulfide isomerase